MLRQGARIVRAESDPPAQCRHKEARGLGLLRGYCARLVYPSNPSSSSSPVGIGFLGGNLNEASSASRDYAPVMPITGTVLMYAGMWSCAALNVQTTYELRY